MGHLDKELRHVSAVSATKPLSVTKLVEKIVQTNWPVKNVGKFEKITSQFAAFKREPTGQTH